MRRGGTLKAGDLDQLVTVMRPAEAQGTRGQPQGQPTTIIQQWPCSIETVSGNKAVQARTVFAEATHKVGGYGNPQKRVKERDYLTGGSLGDRKLYIGFINDIHQNGVELELLCSERTGG